MDLYVDDIEGELPVAHLVSDSHMGFSALNARLLPTNGRFGLAYFHARIELSQTSFQDETEVTDDFTRVVGPVTCTSTNEESWFKIETNRLDWTGEHTRNRSDLPEWITEEGDEGYIEVELSFDPDLTVEETAFSHEDLVWKQEEYQKKYFDS
ncbi:hypothetical protein ACFQL4_19160 [Halosimplex aquaticum]